VLPERPVGRADALIAVASAAAVLVLCETVYALAERWHHPNEYLALSAALTLAPALAIGLAGSLFGLGAGLALTLAAAGAGWARFDVTGAIAFGLAALVAILSRSARRVRPATLGVAAALALAAAFLKGPSVAEHLGHADELPYEVAGGAVLLAFILGGSGLVLARLSPRVPAAPLLALLGIACTLRPLLDAPDGTRRLPPADYARSAPRAPGGGELAPVFLLVLDTVRADHLSVYGYGRETTPELDRFVQQRDNAVVYTRAFANGTWTVPSHASLFTGRLPSEHGAHFALDGSVRFGFGLADGLPTLAESMKAAGYATLAGYANHWLRSVRGMGRGFDRYLRSMERDSLPFVGEALRSRYLPGVCWGVAKGGARADEVDATLLSMVEPWSRGPNPLFVFANYGDAHGPYAPPAPFRGRFAPTDERKERAEHLSLRLSLPRRTELEARYDEEIAYLDSQLGELFRELERLGLLERSWIFVTSDHGEAFGEHGVLEHGTTVFNEVTHIPLVVFPPVGEELAPANGPVSLVDVAATIAAIGGAHLDGPGRDLRQPLRGETPVVIEFYGDPVKAATMGELARQPARSVVLGRFKLIALGDAFHLYDLDADEHEQVDLATALPRVVEHMKPFLPEFGAPTFAVDGLVPAPEELDALREMGYAGEVTE